jgi:anti-sigma factor RsiW
MNVLSKLFSKSLVCQEAVELMTDYLEDALSRRDRARFEKHLAQCPHCTEYLEEIRTTVILAGSIEPEVIPEQVQRDLEAVFQQWKSDKT